MDRVLSAEEKIRRAEEIYYRKKQLNNSKTATLNINSKKDYKLLKKIIVQILICIGIYWGISLAKSNEELFFKDLIVQARQITTYEMDFKQIIEDASNYINGFIKTDEIKEKDKEEATSNAIEETLSATTEKDNQEEEKKEDESKVEEKKTDEEVSSISQMEQDALYIKENYSIVKPLEGTITSRFGLRNPSTPTVPTYHTGIDIAVNEGTVFTAAMEGKVELVSSQGDYRKSCKNNKWRCYDFICTL